MKIPAGTQTGTKFRLRGKGVPNVRGYGVGDQHIRENRYAYKIDRKTKTITAEFAEISGNVPEEQQSFFSKMKRAFKGD